MELREFVAQLIDTHGTNDPTLICNHLGIDIEYIDGTAGNVRGLATFVLGDPVILINQNLVGFNKKFVIAHELCHILRHDIPMANFYKKHTLQKAGKLEKEANAFAALLLLDPATGSFLLNNDSLDSDLIKLLEEIKYQY